MKTVVIPDSLHTAVKLRAMLEGKTLQGYVEDALGKALLTTTLSGVIEESRLDRNTPNEQNK